MPKNYKDDATAAGLGAAGGAAAMPMRSPHARGLRQIDNQNVWNAAEKAGGKAGSKVDMDIDPNQFARISQQKGKRLFNTGYTTEAARAHQAGEFSYPEGKRYTLTAYKDSKGRVELRQQDGRHMGEVHAMRGKKIPTTIHMVQGDMPAENSAVKAVLRPVRSAIQRRKMATNINLTPAQIDQKAKTYPKRLADRVNRDLVHRYGHNPGQATVDQPWKGKSLKGLKRKQAAYIGGGAAAVWAADKATEKVGGKPVAQETVRQAVNLTDKTRDTTADLIHTNKVKKDFGIRVRLAPVSTIEDIIKAQRLTDNQERTAAGSAGAVGGGLLMPVRDKIGKYPKAFADKYKDIPEGTHQMRMPSADLQTIAAPGVREKYALWRDKKTNIDYTTKMAADIHRGKKVGDGNKPRIAIYNDAARVTGGQHRVHANAWSGMKDQDVEVVRMNGYYGGTERGYKALRTRAKRRVYPKMFINANPKDTADLLAREARIDTKRADKAKKGATDTARATLHPAMNSKQLRLLRGKQAAYLAGGTGAAVGARELYRRNYG